jgi:hypothetical protein
VGDERTWLGAAGEAGRGGACSLVVVVGEDSTEDEVEKYADVGVMIDGGLELPPGKKP